MYRQNCAGQVDVMEDSSLVPFEKLLSAFSDFGFESGSVHHEEILAKLQITDEDLVPFGEFVRCVKDLYRMELAEKLGIHTVESNGAAKERLQIENDTLRAENKNLKLQLESMENACSKAEDDLVRVRKELQLQLENVKNLTAKLRSDSQARKIVSDDNDGTNTSRITNQRKQQMSGHRVAALKLLEFIEELHRSLSEIKVTNRRIGRSCSLYRNSSCMSASKCNSVLPQPRVVTRAATVGTSSKTVSAVVSTQNDRSAVQDKLPRYVRGGRTQLDQSQLIRKIVDDASVIIDAVKPILKEANEQVDVSADSCDFESSKNVVDAIKKLHTNLTESAVVTIMTRV